MFASQDGWFLGWLICEQVKIGDHFTDFDQAKIDGCFADFKQVKIDGYFANFEGAVFCQH